MFTNRDLPEVPQAFPDGFSKVLKHAIYVPDFDEFPIRFLKTFTTSIGFKIFLENIIF